MIVVTGATGMLGAHMLWHLLQENESVTGLVRDESKLDSVRAVFQFYGDENDTFFSKIVWKKGDVTDIESLTAAFSGAKQLYHCAALVNLGENGDEMMRVNYEGTRNVAEAALACGVGKLCFVSSTSALYSGDDKSMISEIPEEGNEVTSDYGESKRQAEAVLKLAGKRGLSYVTVNPSVILGYSKEMSGSGELFKRVKSGLPFYTKGVSGYVAVEDVVRAMILLMKSEYDKERFLISGENRSHKYILREIADGYGKYHPFIPINRALMMTVAAIAEFVGKLFRFKPLLDRTSAQTSLNKNYYSTTKFQTAFPDFQFTPLTDAIQRVCKFDAFNSGKSPIKT